MGLRIGFPDFEHQRSSLDFEVIDNLSPPKPNLHTMNEIRNYKSDDYRSDLYEKATDRKLGASLYDCRFINPPASYVNPILSLISYKATKRPG